MPCGLYFGLMKSATDTKYLMDKWHVKMSDLNWHIVEADTYCIVLYVKHACELIFQPSIVVKYINTDVLTKWLFHK